jgi:hypothetical protein
MTHKEEIKLREILENFANWLHIKSYIDSDFYTEEPTAIDEYIHLLKNNPLVKRGLK